MPKSPLKSGKVVCIGEAMVEMATVGEGLFKQSFAGDTYNTAWHMAQLLGEAADVHLATRVGQDNLSDRFCKSLEDDGLNAASVQRDPARNMGLYLIELDGVERSFQYWRSQSAAKLLADDHEQLDIALIDASRIHFSGITLAILDETGRSNLFSALQNAKSKGASICFDPNIRPTLWACPEEVRETIVTFLPVIDIALPSFDDEVACWGDANPQNTIERFLGAGVREVVVKNGAASAHFASDIERGEVPTPKVEDIRDTTGAGDAFNAGYLAARSQGKSMSDSIALAQAVSAEVICHFGAKAPKMGLRALSQDYALDSNG